MSSIAINGTVSNKYTISLEDEMGNICATCAIQL